MHTHEIIPPGLRKFRAAREAGRVLALERKIKDSLVKANPDLAKPERATLLRNLIRPRLAAALNAQ